MFVKGCVVMKKALTIVMICIIFYTNVIVGYCVQPSVVMQQIAKRDGTGEIQITVCNEIEDEYITVQVFGPNGSLRQIHQEVSKAKNAICIPFLPVTGEVNMKVVVGVPKIGGAIEQFEKNFDFYSYIVQQTSIQEIILTKTEESIYKNKEILSIPTEELFDHLTNKNLVLQKLAQDYQGKEDIEVSEFLDHFNLLCRLAALNTKDIKLIKDMIENYKDELNLTDSITEYNWYQNSSKKTEIVEKLANRSFQNVAEFTEDFKSVNFLFQLSDTPALNIIDLLKSQNQKYIYDGERLNIDFSSYDALSYPKREVARTLITGTVYQNFQELKTKFYQAIEKAKTEKPISDNGGAKGGRSSGSSMIAEINTPPSPSRKQKCF